MNLGTLESSEKDVEVEVEVEGSRSASSEAKVGQRWIDHRIVSSESSHIL